MELIAEKSDLANVLVKKLAGLREMESSGKLLGLKLQCQIWTGQKRVSTEEAVGGLSLFSKNRWNSYAAVALSGIPCTD